MRLNVSALNGLPLAASDGEIGTVADLLFGEDDWRLRWLAVDTGSWLAGRRVLVPAARLGRLDRNLAALPVALTRKDVEEGPGAETPPPMSRQAEAALSSRYGGSTTSGTAFPPPLAGGAGAWGAIGALARQRAEASSPTGHEPDALADPTLRSAREMTGYAVAGLDEAFGHVEDLMLDADDLALSHLLVDTSTWWPGRRVLVPSSAIREIEPASETIRVGLTRQEIETAPDVVDG